MKRVFLAIEPKLLVQSQNQRLLRLNEFFLTYYFESFQTK